MASEEEMCLQVSRNVELGSKGAHRHEGKRAQLCLKGLDSVCAQVDVEDDPISLFNTRCFLFRLFLH
jgi:hypothetical protein